MGIVTNLMHQQQTEIVLHKAGYHSLEQIGRGGTGKVYSASKKQQRSALKVIDFSSYRTQWNRESQMFARLQHVNIVEYRSCFRTNQFGCIEMELMESDLLSTLKHSPLPESKARNLFQQICAALEYCHSKGIAHLDLKPDNILLDSELTTAKLSDFGSSREFTREHKLQFRPVGTRVYNAPELARGIDFYGDKVDIWSAGVVLFTMLTGKWPYDVNSDIPLDVQLLQGQLLNLSMYSFSPDLEDLFRRIFHLDGSQRPSASQLLNHPWLCLPPRPTLSTCGGESSDLNLERPNANKKIKLRAKSLVMNLLPKGLKKHQSQDRLA